MLCVGGSKWHPAGIVLIPVSAKANANATIGGGGYKDDHLEESFLPLYSQDDAIGTMSCNSSSEFNCCNIIPCDPKARD